MTIKKIRTWIILLAVVGATAVLVTGINWARASETAAPAQTTAAQTGTAFTYQGKLVYNGTAVNGACDLTFRLYDAASLGLQIGTNQYKNNVAVNDGLFTVDLDFGDGAFDGGARFLQIVINSCPGGASSVTLTPLIELKAAAYALGLRPGAVISGTTGTMLTGWSKSDTTAAIGLYGYAESSGYAAYGVKGEVSGAGDAGVFGLGPYTGVTGVADASSGTSFGVTGRSDSSNGTGVYGWANSSSGTTYGVYGQADSTSGYGVYSEGNAHVDGQLTWKPITSYLSITPAAFGTASNADSYIQAGNYLRPDSASAVTFYAPVELPHGATVTQFTFYWSDFSASDGSAELFQSDQSGLLLSSMALVSTSGNSGSSLSSTTTTINNSVIDNSQYSYFIQLDLPDWNVNTFGIFITYTINKPH